LKNNPSFLRYRRPGPADPFALRVNRGDRAENPRGDCVLYRATSARRLDANLALDFALLKAEELGLPLVMAEEMPRVNSRATKFVWRGLLENAAAAERLGLRYATEANEELRNRARITVTDEHPTLGDRDATFLIDGNGILPMRAFAKEQYSAKFLRDKAHRLMADMWAPPVRRPAIGDRRSGIERLESFIGSGLPGYASQRNKSPYHVSGLSPYLHFGHIGIYEVAQRVLDSDAPPEDIDAFLEEAVIRRELSFNLCFYRPDHASLSALPDWAKKTLDAHRNDRRKRVDDPVWDLAQRQLEATGTMHGYLRMLWGKKLIEWSDTPEEAHRVMVEMHAKYAIDALDPNTYAGILWCFGKHDRPWFPERPVFGTIRYMSSDSTVKKVRLREIEELVRNATLAAQS
jgi:deoxyribodipyrimidine photo-lyase